MNELEKAMDAFALEGSHERFRVFLSSDPAKGIPIGILSRAIKLTNEPPTGMRANMKRAFCSFNKEQVDEFESKTKSKKSRRGSSGGAVRMEDVEMTLDGGGRR